MSQDVKQNIKLQNQIDDDAISQANEFAIKVDALINKSKSEKQNNSIDQLLKFIKDLQKDYCGCPIAVSSNGEQGKFCRC